MIHREIKQTVLESLTRFPVVALLGPRQVGKTTLARGLQQEIGSSAVYLDLELPSDLGRLSDPELYLSSHVERLVIIDEVQRMPSLFPLMRALVDRNRIPGRFLILGSASPDLPRHASESLAGRIISHELTPFTLKETGGEEMNRLWLRGGFPDSFLAPGDTESLMWREAFIATYLERDIPQLGIRVPATQLRRFWTMLAHLHGQLWNGSQIAAGLGISPPTARNYLDILHDTFIVRQLSPFFVNIGKRLVKSPKVYIRDSGLLHALLRIGNSDDLTAHPVLGTSWEGFVIEQILARLPAGVQAYYYRTAVGAEIDLILVSGTEPPVAVEIKYASAPKPARGFWQAFADLGCRRGYVVYPGAESYPLAENVITLPVGELDKIKI